MRDDQELLIDEDKLREVKEAEQKSKNDRENYLNDWRVTLGTPSGRRIVWDLLGGLKFTDDLFNSDPLIMAGNCAIHREAIKLVKDIEDASPGIVFKIQNEIRSAKK